MSNWKKKDDAKTIWDVVHRNTGLTEKEFLADREYKIRGLTEVAQILTEASKNNTKVTVVGDYDADGITASSIMAISLNSIGIKPSIKLPKRMSEGFGLSEKIVDEIKEGILITVDNGIAAVDAVKKAKGKGLTVIITDHHLPNDDGILPEADYIINPHLPNSAEFSDYCGAGIAYKLCCEFVKDNKIKAIISGLAAIGTVADVMPLIKDNRKIVIEGMKNLLSHETRTTGMGALLEKCYIRDHITSTDIGFRIGPVLNAAGRLYDDGAIMSLKTIAYNGSYANAVKLAEGLVEINELRKALVSKEMENAYYYIGTNCLYGDNPLCLYLPEASEGIAGIIAGRLAEEMKVPCIVFTDTETPDIIKGSGRSNGDIHLKNLLDDNKDLIYKYGGHAEAAGLSIEKINFDKFRLALIESVSKLPIKEYDDTIYYDLEINAPDIPKTIKELKKYEPYGEGNPKPIFKIKGFELVSPRYSGFYATKGAEGKTITLFGDKINATGFGKTEIYKALNEPKCLDFIGTLTENYFNGITPEVEIMHMKDSTRVMEKTSLADLLSQTAMQR